MAAINGGCAGIGMLQALCCDVRFAAEGARFTTAYARRGMPAEYAFAWLLPRLIGIPRALDLLLSARTFDAREAEHLGLVARVVPADELVAAAHAYAADLAANCSPRSMAAIRGQVYGDLDRTFDEAMAYSKRLMQDFAATPDLPEGVASFRERRPPAFPPLDPGWSAAGLAAPAAVAARRGPRRAPVAQGDHRSARRSRRESPTTTSSTHPVNICPMNEERPRATAR